MSDSINVVTNKLLSALLFITNKRLLPHLEIVSLTTGQIIKEPQNPITGLYFPESARLSIISILANNSATEILAVGKEGMLGSEFLLGDRIPSLRYSVQLAGTAIKLPVEILQTEFQQNLEVRNLLLTYKQVQFSHLCQLTACRSHHDLEQRLARWLLIIYDSNQEPTLPLTQQFIASMLGVRRASVTEIAISFQKQNIIQYRRGKITILNSKKLQLVACECYGKMKAEYQRLLEPRFNLKN